jgi:predicted nuclease of predicted toxin-antitoxin system
MNFVADESLDRGIILWLGSQRFDVYSIAESAPGSADIDVLNQAKQTNTILWTEDKDFGDLIFGSGMSHSGIVLVRLSGLSLPLKLALLEQFLDQHQHELPGSFCVVSREGTRVRQFEEP